MEPQTLVAANPTDSPAVTVCINVDYLPLIAGALKQLLLQSTWDTTSPTDLLTMQAKVFGLIDLFNRSTLIEGDCDTVQFRNPDPCTLQVSTDGGETWTTIYSDQTCAESSPNQPGAGGTPAPGACTDFLFDLAAGDQWYFPFSLEDNDTVELLSQSGIWSDGTAEYCPDGQVYSAGSCSGGATSGTDPLPTAYHMSSIIEWPVTGVLPLDIGSITTIPGGTGAVDALIQANAPVLSSLFGQVALKIRVCKAGFSHLFDFILSDGSWVDAGNGSNWVSSSGWHGGTGGPPAVDSDVYIYRTFSARVLRTIAVQYDASGVVTVPLYPTNLHLYLAGVNVYNDTGSQTGSGTAVLKTFTIPDINCDKIVLDFNAGNVIGSHLTITGTRVDGLGVDPF